MHGTNPIRPPVQSDGDALDIQDIFFTLQGEGPYAGWPAVFIRLGGCNLACAFCDTEFESFALHTVEDILQQVRAKAGKGCKLVVITGGEPLRQPIEKLCGALAAVGFGVQIETNGTLYRDLPQEVEWIISPKNTGRGYAPLRPDVLSRAKALKFIISATMEGYTDFGYVGQGEHLPVYLQPMDEYDSVKNAANLARATELALANGCRLSLQLHKIAGIN